MRAENVLIREALLRFEQNAQTRMANGEEAEARVKAIRQKKDRYKAVAG